MGGGGGGCGSGCGSGLEMGSGILCRSIIDMPLGCCIGDVK